jgi:hypothetical protein
MSQDNKIIPPPPPSTPVRPIAKTYRLSQVSLALVCFYGIIFLFDSKGIHAWTTKIPVNPVTQKMRLFAEDHWRQMAKWGLEEPKYSIETRWLDLQEAPHLLYPRKYEHQLLAKQEKKEKLVERDAKWAKNPRLKRDYERSREITTASQATPETTGSRVLIVGDSLMMTVGPVLKEQLELKGNVFVTLKAKLATGLARPDVFDWRQEINQLTHQQKFQAVIVLMGANDSQDFAEDGKILSYGTPEWVRTYKSRIAAVMEGICSKAALGVWVGLPPMQSPSFQKKALRLNQWIARTAEKYPCMKYLDTATVFGSPKGGYLSYLTMEGKSEKIRTTDGIHISKKGAVLLVEPVLGVLSQDPYSNSNPIQNQVHDQNHELTH